MLNTTDCRTADVRRMVFVALLFTASMAQAADWRDIGSTKVGDVVAIDRSTIRQSKPGFYRAWLRWSYLKSEGEGAAEHLSVKVLTSFRCRDWSLASLQTIAYSESEGQGRVVSMESQKEAEAQFLEASPESANDAILQFVCGRRRGG